MSQEQNTLNAPLRAAANVIALPALTSPTTWMSKSSWSHFCIIGTHGSLCIDLIPISKLLDQAPQRASTFVRIANQCTILENLCVDSETGLRMAGTDVLPETEKVAHRLIWDGYKDEV